MLALEILSKTVLYISDKFDNTAMLIEDIPLLGKYLAQPFYFIAEKVDYIADLCINVNDWWEWLKASFLALPTWDELLIALKEHFSLLDNTLDELIDLILEKIPVLPTWIPSSLEAFKELVLGLIPPIPTVEAIFAWVAEGFETILDKIFEEGK